MPITRNQRETLYVIDSISGSPFAVKGNTSNGSIYVETKNSITSTVAIATVAAPTYSEAANVALSTDLSGALRVTGSLSVGGTADNSVFTAGSSTGTPAMGYYHSTIDSVTDGRAAAVGITAKRAMLVTLQTSAGADTGVAASPLQVSLANTAANSNKLLVTPDSVALPANQSVNISQINAVTPLMGNGTTGTGSLRVTVASDNTAFSVNATLSAETTKVIGTVRTADGAGNLWTSNSTTYTAKFGQDSNLLGTLGTAFSTAGKVDVKAADGDVFVRQATATNLKTQAETYQGGAAVAAGNPLLVSLANTAANSTAVKVDNSAVTQPTYINANVSSVGVTLSYQSALTNTKTQIKATAANLYGYRIYNPNAVVIYIQLFNKTSANVTVGTTAPDDVIPVPAGGLIDESHTIADGFATALTIAATTSASNATAPGTTLVATIRYI